MRHLYIIPLFLIVPLFLKAQNSVPKETIKQSSRGKSNSNKDYFLQTGQNLNKKIKDNLFIKVQVDKKSCYAGEPVLATFKLYSSLQSKSDIVKNPGFYGFSVFDMISLSDKVVTAEKVNGRMFDVHTIRKMQLFPLRAGTFVIDPMEVKNKVQFPESAITKRTEQQIVEGVLENENEPLKSDAIYFESDISTEPVSINVKPLPDANRPVNYNGAVGNFSISASLIKNGIARNEEGVFEVTVKGSGNFIQLTAPIVNWPEGIDSFTHSIKDNFDKDLSPLNGYRTFRFPFVCINQGEFEIPPVKFTYFDIDSNRYKSISTSPVSFSVDAEQAIQPPIVKRKSSIAESNKKSSRIAAGIVIGLVLIVLVYWSIRKKEITPEIENAPVVKRDADEVLLQSIISINESSNQFYIDLHQSLWAYLTMVFKLEGSMVNKAQVIQVANQKGIPIEITKQLEYLLSACETGQFANATIMEDRQLLLDASKETINSIEKYLL